MKNTNLLNEIISIVLIAAMFVATAIVWPLVSEPLPTHWNIDGQLEQK